MLREFPDCHSSGRWTCDTTLERCVAQRDSDASVFRWEAIPSGERELVALVHYDGAAPEREPSSVERHLAERDPSCGLWRALAGYDETLVAGSITVVHHPAHVSGTNHLPPCGTTAGTKRDAWLETIWGSTHEQRIGAATISCAATTSGRARGVCSCFGVTTTGSPSCGSWVTTSTRAFSPRPLPRYPRPSRERSVRSAPIERQKPQGSGFSKRGSSRPNNKKSFRSPRRPPAHRRWRRDGANRHALLGPAFLLLSVLSADPGERGLEAVDSSAGVERNPRCKKSEFPCNGAGALADGAPARSGSQAARRELEPRPPREHMNHDQ